MPPTSAVPDRPRVVDTAFWCWLTASILTAALGMLTLSQGGHPFIYFAGGLLFAAGLGQGYLAGRARRGDARFAAAGVGLAMATILFLAMLVLFGAGVAVIAIVAVTMALLVAGAVLLRRVQAQQWFESVS